MQADKINRLRHASRKLVRELGMLQLNKVRLKQTPQHWHALIEISKEPGITISKLGQLLLLSVSALSRIINALHEAKLVTYQEGVDKREKTLYITSKGRLEIENIDEFSNTKIKRAFAFLSEAEQEEIIGSIQKYAMALEQSRLCRQQVKVLTLSTSRPIRKQIISMIETIQSQEFSLPITEEINACVLKAEEDFYYHRSYNFWYAVDAAGTVIGCIGLKKLSQNNAEIKKFFVNQSYRGKGVAQKLMSVLLKSATKHGFTSLYLGTVGKLQAAQQFYKKYGFLSISEQQLPSGFVKCPLDHVFFKVKVKDLSAKIAVAVE